MKKNECLKTLSNYSILGIDLPQNLDPKNMLEFLTSFVWSVLVVSNPSLCK
jgi:hypothetical protein